jgi:hypothetical protein
MTARSAADVRGIPAHLAEGQDRTGGRGVERAAAPDDVAALGEVALQHPHAGAALARADPAREGVQAQRLDRDRGAERRRRAVRTARTTSGPLRADRSVVVR